MPPKGKSKALAAKHSFIGKFSANSKENNSLDKKLIDQNLQIESKRVIFQELSNKTINLNDEIEKLKTIESQLTVQVKELSKSIHVKQNKINRKSKVIEDIEKRTENLKKPRIETIAFSISSKTKVNRKAKPYHRDISERAKYDRRKEAFEACALIFGGSDENKTPTIQGMIDTLTSKVKSDELSKEILDSKPALVNNIKRASIIEWKSEFKLSEQNTLRSLNTYYSHDVMGKRKYLSICRTNRNTGVPNYVPYPLLSKRINEIDIGAVIPVSPTLTRDENQVYDGMFRPPAPYIIRLAKFYLNVYYKRKDDFKQFSSFSKKDPNSIIFNIAFGGDGAPATGTAFLVSFLNVGKRIASSNENFLIFGSNADETSAPALNFVKLLVSDLKHLEGRTFDIIDNQGAENKVEFKVSELPNDMKMAACLAGEITNSAHFFSTYGNVNNDDANDLTKTFGLKGSGADWQPFEYSKRVSDAKKVAKEAERIEKGSQSDQRKRNLLTTYIRSLKSRQEFQPLVEEYVDRMKCEPLQLKNNTCKDLFMSLLRTVVKEAKIATCKNVGDIPEGNIFLDFLSFVHHSMNCNFLKKKLVQWFDDNSGNVDKDFTFRFRGKESYAYMKNFPTLIELLMNRNVSRQTKEKFAQYHFISVQHRKMISYMVRIVSFNEAILSDMKSSARKLFVGCCLFTKSVSPSMWTVCNVAPVQAETCFKEYGMGLGCVTMEGREQKHQRIEKYSQNTTFQCRWPLIFRHEFIQLVYLRENGFDQVTYKSKDNRYLPEINEFKCSNCALTKVDGSCPICSSKEYAAVLELVKSKLEIPKKGK